MASPDSSALKTIIDAAFEDRATITTTTSGTVRDAVEAALDGLDAGTLRVAEKIDGNWVVHEWLKKAILLYFRLTPNAVIAGGPGGSFWFDKSPSKLVGWDEAAFAAAGFRAVPGALVRRGAYVAPGAVLIPSFVNLGAYVSAGVMVDSWVTVGSCAQIGKDVHLSSGCVIGGVLEPLQANPVIVEDNCFVGANTAVTEGVIVEEGSVIASGVQIGASTKIIDRATGEMFAGRVPSYSVVTAGSLPGKALPDGTPGPSLYCAVIVKRVDERTRSKTSINELLRD